MLLLRCVARVTCVYISHFHFLCRSSCVDDDVVAGERATRGNRNPIVYTPTDDSMSKHNVQKSLCCCCVRSHWRFSGKTLSDFPDRREGRSLPNSSESSCFPLFAVGHTDEMR